MKNFLRGLMFVATLLMAHSAYAQSCYQYSGPAFTYSTGVYTSSNHNHVTGTLILTSPITSSISLTSLTAPSFLTMSDGLQTIDTTSPLGLPLTSIIQISTQSPFNWYVALGQSSPVPPTFTPLNLVLTTGNLFQLPSRYSNFDEGFLGVILANHADENSTFSNPTASPWILTNDLSTCAKAVIQSILADVHAMNITWVGARINSRLIDVASDLASLHHNDACEDVKDIVEDLKSKRDHDGISSTQSAALRSGLTSLKYVLTCRHDDD